MKITLIITPLSDGRHGCTGFLINKEESGLTVHTVLTYKKDNTFTKLINIIHSKTDILLGTALQTYKEPYSSLKAYPYDSVFCPADGIIIEDTIIVSKEDLYKFAGQQLEGVSLWTVLQWIFL